MIDLRVKGDVTKGRLMEAVERLVAEKGFDAVSVRDITGLAKANVAAVNYHFGSREGLLAAMLEQRMKPVFAERTQRLEMLRAAATLREVFQAWVQPLLHTPVGKGLGEMALGRILGRCSEAMAAGLNEGMTATALLAEQTMLRVIESRCPHLEVQQIAWRFHMAQGALIHSLVHGSAVTEHFRLAQVAEQWVDAMVSQFATADATVTVTRSRESQVKSPRKQSVAAPLRQIAEVVAAAMEVVESPATAVVAESPEDISPDTQSQDEPAESVAAPAKKPARSKKSTADDGMGELFLF